MTEGKAEFYIYRSDEESIPSKSMSVFYNARMEINRDISNLAIIAYNKLYNKNPLIIVDTMAASGVSSIRMLKECSNIEKIYINDINPVALDLINQNLSLNNFDDSPAQILVSRKDANFLLSEIANESFIEPNRSHQKPNIISIDPFGTPNLYLDAAFKAVKQKNGLLCVTATDTAVLFGVRPQACIRKYMSKPLHTNYCKEIGARILIYFISRIANVNKMGIIPLLTFYNSHFIRIFCLTFKDQKRISQFFRAYGYLIHCKNCGYRTSIQNNILELPKNCPSCDNNNTFDYAGPLWVFNIHDTKFLDEMLNLNEESQYNNKKRIEKLLSYNREEVDMPIFYYNIHKLSKILKIPTIPKLDTIIETIKLKGFDVSRTHFDFLSIKTNMDIESVKEVLLELQITKSEGNLAR
ncbi:MAG: tRNA (guanine(10)-N(2))-dimethyltransferase [Promethearchaeota archaeon]